MNNTIREKFSSQEDSRLWAQFISFAPVVFQAAKSLRNLGLLEMLDSNESGTSYSILLEKSALSDYSLRVILDAGDSCGLLFEKENLFYITPAGRHIVHDPLTNVNMNFTGDVCYQGLAHLEDSLKNEKPEGLQVFGKWKTIYEGLTRLPAKALKSWLEFDHYFSDDAFPRALPIVCKDSPRKILDVGGNTGKFAVACAQFSPGVSITMLDHPSQLELAGERIQKHNLDSRISRVPMNLLDHSVAFPKGHDVIWMSQFLDCFSKEDIAQLFRRTHEAMNPDGTFFIMETFIDRQRYEAAKFCLDMTSLYFTCLANGNSRMYRATDFYELLEKAGFVVVEELNIRLSHTLLKCKLR